MSCGPLLTPLPPALWALCMYLVASKSLLDTQHPADKMLKYYLDPGHQSEFIQEYQSHIPK